MLLTTTKKKKNTIGLFSQRLAFCLQRTSSSGCVQQRRQIKLLLFSIVVAIIILLYRIQTAERLWLLEAEKEAASKAIVLKDAGGNIVSRISNKNGLKLSDFLPPPIHSPTTKRMTLTQAIKGREPILDILLDAGIHIGDDDIRSILQLPTWENVTELYGDQPVIVGLEQCQAFQNAVPLNDRFLGVAGTFNSGTTAFGVSLQANCRFPHRTNNNDPFANKNDKVTHANGMLSQVPWAKHKMAFRRDTHTILDTIPKSHVLPIVLVRDPYFWMQSMCKQGYGVRWDHSSREHCPNLIPNAHDKRRFGHKWAREQQQANESIRVWMGANPHVGPSWDSLVHYWNAWYESYYYDRNTGGKTGNMQSWPRLIIRFEDTLFHPKQVMETVCQCGGGQLAESNFRYLLDEAKWNHKQEQNNLITAMIKYGKSGGRFRNMTAEDIVFAKASLNPKLLEAFHYRDD